MDTYHLLYFFYIIVYSAFIKLSIIKKNTWLTGDLFALFANADKQRIIGKHKQKANISIKFFNKIKKDNIIYIKPRLNASKAS